MPLILRALRRSSVLIVSICAGVIVLCSFGGGITSSLSFAVSRFTSSLSPGLPGTIAVSPDSAGFTAVSRVSSRSPALRFSSSGPWHWKQVSEKIGRMSRLNETLSDAGESATATAAPSPRKAPRRAREEGVVEGIGCGGIVCPF